MRTLSFDIEIPDWCNYVAQDCDGEWWGYKDEPICHSSLWDRKNRRTKMCRLTTSSRPEDFTQELYKVT